MPVDRLDHINIRCADVERTRAFYCDVLGLTVGPRPGLGVGGYWLYCGGSPQVHIGPAEAPSPGASNGAFDHVAFRITDPDAMIEKLKAHDIPFQDRDFSKFGFRQLVVNDPDGIMVELNCGA